MRNKKAKLLKRIARELTVGMPESETKKRYKQMKKVYKLEKGEI